jgi:hypothetical protein
LRHERVHANLRRLLADVPAIHRVDPGGDVAHEVLNDLIELVFLPGLQRSHKRSGKT